MYTNLHINTYIFTANDPYSRAYVFENYKELWFIESNVTFRGVYVGGDQSGNYSDTNFVEYKIKPSGNIGNYYYGRQSSMKEGDAPSFLYVVDPEHANRNYSDATLPNWGGQYKLYYKDMPVYYGDISSDENNASQSVNEWRTDYLNDWEKRLQMLYS